MSNLSKFNDIYTSLAESSYKNRPNSFPKYENQSEVTYFDYSISVTDENRNLTQGGKNLPNNGIIYLQPDKSGSLTNQPAGYNAYFVTDQPAVSDSQETYFVIDEVKIIQALSFFIYRKFSKRGHTVNF